MDAQLKKGFLEACILATLSRGDSYGYQIVKDVSTCIQTSESTLYPILKRLESAGSLKTYSVEHGGRLRKYYRITSDGIEKINEFLTSWPEIESIYRYIKEGSHA